METPNKESKQTLNPSINVIEKVIHRAHTPKSYSKIFYMDVMLYESYALQFIWVIEKKSVSASMMFG